MKEQILFSEEQIRLRVRELAEQISAGYAEEGMCVIVLAVGGIIFASDLIRSLPENVLLDVLKTSSYRGGTEHGTLQILSGLKIDIRGKKVLLVDDILDSGNTLQKVSALLRTQEAKEVRTCVLLDKPSRRKVPVQADYAGFTIPDRFVFGYGMDDAEGKYRNLPYIAYPAE